MTVFIKDIPAYYLADSQKFRDNFQRLQGTFSKYYSHFTLAYSYKTNYLPSFCRLVNQLGGYAEVVSTMELELALKVGVQPDMIIWNGPYKPAESLKDFLLSGGLVNVDNLAEAQQIATWAGENPQKKFRVGLRCNFDIGDKNISRFGLEAPGKDFAAALKLLTTSSNILFSGLHCHFSPRNLATWQARVTGMLALLREYKITPPRLDFGGSLFGEMVPTTAAQYKTAIPTWEEYAQAITRPLLDYFGPDNLPELVLEPGSALVGNCLAFVAQVLDIKEIRGKAIATVLGSSYNLTQSLSRKNPPITVIPGGREQKQFTDLDIGGFTCIDFDYLARHFSGSLAVGDYLVFHDVGAYSLVLRPPFILPNFPVYENGADGLKELKRAETFTDIFNSYQLSDDSSHSNHFESNSFDANGTNGI